jgi:hypothetical protein
VDYWDSCDAERTNYTVRINNGGNVQIVTGFFTGPGDQGGRGDGRTVATFQRLTGPTRVGVTTSSTHVTSDTAAKQEKRALAPRK